MMGKYNRKAEITDLQDNFIQYISFRQISPRNIIGGFMGSGQASLGQTLDIITQDILNPRVQPFSVRIKINNDTFILQSLQTHNASPLQKTEHNRIHSILSLR